SSAVRVRCIDATRPKYSARRRSSTNRTLTVEFDEEVLDYGCRRRLVEVKAPFAVVVFRDFIAEPLSRMVFNSFDAKYLLRPPIDVCHAVEVVSVSCSLQQLFFCVHREMHSSALSQSR